MEFERARTKEQKDMRIAEIIEAALKQYNEMPYDKITLASISKELSFSRVNLYKYFKTKEEIFLKIIELDAMKWIDKLNLIFAGNQSASLESFARKWASALYSQKRMLGLLSRLFSELEKNTAVEKLSEFKLKYIDMHLELTKIIKEQMPNLGDKLVDDFITSSNIFAMGLYSMATPSDNQIKAMELAGLEHKALNFVDTLTSFIVTYVTGMLAEK